MRFSLVDVLHFSVHLATPSKARACKGQVSTDTIGLRQSYQDVVGGRRKPIFLILEARVVGLIPRSWAAPLAP